MDIMMDDTVAGIARRIRLEREARVWSLADLAARAGVGKATVSKIERGEMSPTAAMLVRLAGAFDLTLAGLLLRAEAGDRLVRAVDQPLWRDPASGYVRRQVFARPDHPVEIVEVELPPGARVALPAASYAHIRQVVWLRTGFLTIAQGTQRHRLNPGDSLAFGPPADTDFINETQEPSTYVVALSRS
jgi:transcriptional regulator with XRE-family HTH domain